jgi:tetratricopeptide (TPR) repeat protein
MIDQENAGGAAESSSARDAASNPAAQGEHIEGEQVITGDNVGGDKITVSGVQDATVAAGRRAAAAGRGGIAISGDVGRDLVISIGETKITVPRWVQLVLAIAVCGVAFLVAVQGSSIYQSAQPVPMEGDHNIAIAQFQVESRGEGQEHARDLAQGFANALELSIEELEQDLLQSDKVEVRPPQETGEIRGKDKTARAEKARALAESINADVVVYGTVKVDDRLQATVQPRFIVNRDPNDEFSQAAEITGDYRMGYPIPIEKVTNKRARDDAELVLVKRSKALVYILNGIGDYFGGEYADAKDKFERALDENAWNTPDIIYVMLGNVALKQRHLQEAHGYFEKALTQNGQYSRAHIGLGDALYGQALPTESNGDGADVDYDAVIPELLDEAIESYLRALDPTSDRPPLADVTTKANFALGQAYLLRALTALKAGKAAAGQQDWEQATQAFLQVIDDYQNGGNDRVEELAAHAHARLGLMYRLEKKGEQAAEQYKQALQVLPKLKRTQKDRAKYEAALEEMGHGPQ